MNLKTFRFLKEARDEAIQAGTPDGDFTSEAAVELLIDEIANIDELVATVIEMRLAQYEFISRVNGCIVSPCALEAIEEETNHSAYGHIGLLKLVVPRFENEIDYIIEERRQIAQNDMSLWRWYCKYAVYGANPGAAEDNLRGLIIDYPNIARFFIRRCKKKGEEQRVRVFTEISEKESA